MDDTNEKQKGSHLFKPGQSGNPRGRPVGAKSKTTTFAEQILMNNSARIVRKVIEKALAGDPACLKMCLDRIIPAQRAIDITKTETKDQQINIFVEPMKALEEKQVIDVKAEVIDAIRSK